MNNSSVETPIEEALSTEQKIKALREAIMASKDLDDWPKIQAFEPNGENNYICISYSHKDYKPVYCDIVNMALSGVRVWYDEGLSAGINWRKEVEKRIADPCCSGVIFYLSENLFTSSSIQYEISLIYNKKPFFAVNLTDKQPFKILQGCIDKINSSDDNMDWLHNLSGAFTDAKTYLPYNGANHDKNLLRQIKKQFNVTVESQTQTKVRAEATTDVPPQQTNNKKEDVFLINDGVLEKYIGESKSVIIPTSVKIIGNNAFKNTVLLENVTIPDSVIRIENGAFSENRHLKSVVLPAGLEYIGDEAFANCEKLTNIILPNSITHIGRRAFERCYSIENLALPEGLTKISPEAFIGCGGIKHLTLSQKLTHIGARAFFGCRNLEAISIPNGVTDIDDGAFEKCSYLKGIALPFSLTSLGDNVFANCHLLTTVTLPDSITNIGKGIFANCGELTNVILPNNLTYISNEMFFACFKLEEINIPKSVTNIGCCAFEDCLNLHNIELPDGLISIGDNAFSHSGIYGIFIPASVTEIGRRVFKSTFLRPTIHTPRGSFAAKYARKRFMKVNYI